MPQEQTEYVDVLTAGGTVSVDVVATGRLLGIAGDHMPETTEDTLRMVRNAVHDGVVATDTGWPALIAQPLAFRYDAR